MSPAAPGAALARVLELLRLRTGRDLSQYKASSIERRLERRLAVHRLATLDDYAGYLEANPEEAELLLRELLIGVTQFFRDDEAFVVLRDQALPAVVARKRPPRVLRAWVAGCSSGEEAYSLAIIVSEVLAQAGAADVHVQIYATDLDGDAIAHARAGRYAHDIAAQVSPDRLARHFTRDDRGYAVRAELRDRVVFAKHDLISDPPFTRLDVVCCRNVLIYLQPALQHKLVSQFHYALGPGGLLVLGASEAIPATAAALFGAFDGKAKVFRRLDVAPTRAAPLGLAAAPQAPGAGAVHHDAAVPSVVEAARHAIVETVAPPTVLINGRGDVLYASRRTGRYLEPAVGKANINIFAMAREGLAAHLSLGVREATARRRRVTLAGVEVRGERARYLVDLVVVPLDEPAVLRGSLLVVFDEPPPVAKPRARARRAGSASLERELVRLKQHLQAVAREMEASQLEAEAANEALQCANEELQSTNEEVTTSKEELQAMNEELLTLNAELEAKNSELATANDDLRNLLNSTKLPTLFLDNALRLKRFTSEVTRIANVQPGDVGRVITDLTLKLAYRELARDVAEVLETLIAKEVAVTSDDGTTYLMRIHPYRTTQNALDGVVVTFFDLGALRRAEAIIAAGPRVVP